MNAHPQEPPAANRRNPSELALPGGFGRAVKLLGGVLILLVIGLFFGRNTWKASHRNKAREQVQDARQAIEKKEWANAAELIRNARSVLQEDPELLRVLVDYLDKTGLDPFLEIQALQSLQAQGWQQPGDAILTGRAHVRKGDLVAARVVWQKLSPEQQRTPDALKFKAQILSQEGGAEASGKLQQLATQKSANDPQSALMLAIRDLESSYPAMAASGRARLWQFADRDDEAGMQAIRHLLTKTSLNLAETKQLQQRVQKHPEAKLADELGALSAMMRLDPARRSQLLEEVIERHRGAGFEIKVVIARWLAQEKEHGRLTKLLPVERMIKSGELFPIYLQALAESGRWQQMHELLNHPQGLPMALEGITVWRALASSRLQPDLDQAAVELKLAIKQAGTTKNFGPLRAAAQVAEDLELWDIAMEGYLQIAQPDSPQEFDMLEKCWQIAGHLGDSSHLLNTARKQSTLRPTSRYFASRLDYVRLLRGQEIESTVSDQRVNRADEKGGSTLEALVAALKAYRLGNASLAKANLMQVRDAASMPVGQRAVFAGLLASVGDPARAFQLAEKISSTLLIAEEQTFLRKAL
jgi:hypothetical protein